MNYLLEALIKKLEGEVAMAKANIQVYMTNPAVSESILMLSKQLNHRLKQ